MSRLILVNGPPGIGKSTIASLYADRHPGTLNLDIDHVRMLVGGWCDDFVGTGEIVRPLVLHMAAAHLEGGRDVIVPQYLAANDEVAAFKAVADECSADFVEILLIDTRESAIERFNLRRAENDQLSLVVDTVVATSGGDGHLRNLYDDLVRDASARRHVELESTPGDVEAVYSQLCSIVDSSP
jgi:predicted kinase